MQNQFTVCVLTFRDCKHLVERCLESISGTSGLARHVQDFRIGLNDVTAGVHEYVQSWARQVVAETGVPTKIYEPVWDTSPALKYPVMRRMFHDAKDWPAPVLMWFDDDSYLDRLDGWWNKIASITTEHTVVGQIWERDLEGNQWQWIRAQPWASNKIMFHAKFRFPQGAWWCVHRDFVHTFDYPWPELRHCGGDCTFGELCLHRGIAIYNFDEGVHINADGLGRHSMAARRGYREDLIGRRYSTGKPVPLHHQNVHVRTWWIRR